MSYFRFLFLWILQKKLFCLLSKISHLFRHCLFLVFMKTLCHKFIFNILPSLFNDVIIDPIVEFAEVNHTDLNSMTIFNLWMSYYIITNPNYYRSNSRQKSALNSKIDLNNIYTICYLDNIIK